LEVDKPFSADRCGSCTRCIQACPTGCILGDRTIDASRCISYLTIELKGAIPAELRPQIENWVFGCDICQQVCPWNQRFATPSKSDQVDVHLVQPELISELALSPQAFNDKFKGSPVKRPKRRGYLRNVAVALGNSGSTSGVPQLIETLKSEQEPLVRGHAAWSLGRIGNQQARHALKTALIDEQDPYVLEEIHSGLGA